MQQGAYADVTVKLGLIKLLTKRFDVCEELSVTQPTFNGTSEADMRIIFLRDNADADLQCPIKPDEYKIEQTVALPAEIPRGQSPADSTV